MQIGNFVQCHWQKKEVVFQESFGIWSISIYHINFCMLHIYMYKYSLWGLCICDLPQKWLQDALELELHLSFKYNILFIGICKRSFGLQRDSRNNIFTVDKYEKVEVWDVDNFEWTTTFMTGFGILTALNKNTWKDNKSEKAIIWKWWKMMIHVSRRREEWWVEW